MLHCWFSAIRPDVIFVSCFFFSIFFIRCLLPWIWWFDRCTIMTKNSIKFVYLLFIFSLVICHPSVLQISTYPLHLWILSNSFNGINCDCGFAPRLFSVHSMIFWIFLKFQISIIRMISNCLKNIYCSCSQNRKAVKPLKNAQHWKLIVYVRLNSQPNY